MPGPYDLQYEERGYTERLPLGLGSDNLLVASWPDIALMGGGSLLSRAGVRHAMGRSMLGWGRAGRGRGMQGVRRNLARRGRAAHRIDRVQRYLQRSQSLAGARGVGPLAARTPATRQAARAMAARGAKMTYVGGMARGLGIGLLGLTMFTVGLDVSKMVGEAAMDWKPRRDSGSPHEFGHVFYDPRGAFTQRQRAIAAIHDSQLTTRAALGGEAAFMHS